MPTYRRVSNRWGWYRLIEYYLTCGDITDFLGLSDIWGLYRLIGDYLTRGWVSTIYV